MIYLLLWTASDAVLRKLVQTVPLFAKYLATIHASYFQYQHLLMTTISIWVGWISRTNYEATTLLSWGPAQIGFLFFFGSLILLLSTPTGSWKPYTPTGKCGASTDSSEKTWLTSWLRLDYTKVDIWMIVQAPNHWQHPLHLCGQLHPQPLPPTAKGSLLTPAEIDLHLSPLCFLLPIHIYMSSALPEVGVSCAGGKAKQIKGVKIRSISFGCRECNYPLCRDCFVEFHSMAGTIGSG